MLDSHLMLSTSVMMPGKGKMTVTGNLRDVMKESIQPDTPTLSEAIRRLVELGLTIRAKVKQPSAARADRAKELATKTIEKMMDPSASPEDRAQRRRRLVKGPSESANYRPTKDKSEMIEWFDDLN